jgi:hypothetical protein
MNSKFKKFLIKEGFAISEGRSQRMFYFRLNHGAMLILASSAEEALEKAGNPEDAEGIEELPEVTYISNDGGIEWSPADNHDPVMDMGPTGNSGF